MGRPLEVCSLDGTSIHVMLDGDPARPAITFGHSLAATGAMWDCQVKLLADEFFLIRPDFRGHGLSGVPPGPYAFENFALDILAVWDALRVQESAYVGLSLGGVVGIPLALLAPDRVSSLVLSSCRFSSTPFYRAMWSERLRQFEEGGMKAVAAATLPSWIMPETMAADSAIGRRLEHMIETSDPQGWRATVAAFGQLDYKNQLHEIGTNTVMICGDRDPALPDMVESAALMPAAQMVVLPDAAHLANIDQPEAFAAVIRSVQAAASHPAREGSR